MVQQACGKSLWFFPRHIKDLQSSCFLIFVQGDSASATWLLEKEELLPLIFNRQATCISIKQGI